MPKAKKDKKGSKKVAPAKEPKAKKAKEAKPKKAKSPKGDKKKDKSSNNKKPKVELKKIAVDDAWANLGDQIDQATARDGAPVDDAKAAEIAKKEQQRKKLMDAAKGDAIMRAGTALHDASVPSEEDLKQSEEHFGLGVFIEKDVYKLLNPVEFNKKGERLRVNFLNQYQVEDLVENPDKAMLNDLFTYFDLDKGGTLDGYEIRMLAIEMIERTLVFIAEVLLERNPTMGKTKLNYETLREAYFFLPGECRDDITMITDMIRLIATVMDPANEGEITQIRFCNLWQSLAREIWIYRDPPPLGYCVIL